MTKKTKSGYRYNFPAHTVVAEKDIDQQLNKIMSECEKLIDAYNNVESLEHLVEECMDVIHACETCLRITDIDLDIVHALVVGKNKRRGYYKEGQC